MITEWLMNIGTGFANWIANLFPELDIPAQLVSLDESVNAIFDMGDGLGAWIDFGYVGLVAAIPLTVWAAGLTVRGLRALIAHIPFIGGKG